MIQNRRNHLWKTEKLQLFKKAKSQIKSWFSVKSESFGTHISVFDKWKCFWELIEMLFEVFDSILDTFIAKFDVLMIKKDHIVLKIKTVAHMVWYAWTRSVHRSSFWLKIRPVPIGCVWEEKGRKQGGTYLRPPGPIIQEKTSKLLLPSLHGSAVATTTTTTTIQQ